MMSTVKRLLFSNLSLDRYLRVLSAGFFAGLKIGVRGEIYDYPRFLKHVVRQGDTVLDLGANLGYYSRILSRLVGPKGRVYAVEPVVPIRNVLEHNLRRCQNVEIVPFALGVENRKILMLNDSVRQGYMGTGRNYIADGRVEGALEFEVEMRCGSEIFGDLPRIDFIKCDIEGYENVVIPELEPLIVSHLPIVLLETGGVNRRTMIELFRRWGYGAYVLDGGRLVSVMRAPERDIFFVPGTRLNSLICT